jgi:hypothetical protein
MAEEVAVPAAEDLPNADPEADAEAAALATADANGNKTVPLSALIGVKRANKELEKRIKALEPVAARVTDVEGRLERASPIIEAVINNPKLRAAAMAKTRPSGEYTEQPEDDPDAKEWATENDLWTQDADGKSVLDIARAQRQLAIADRRMRRQNEATNRPLAEMVMGSRVDANIQEMYSAKDDDGVPYATQESLNEAISMLGVDGRRLLADPRVKDLILTNAAGIDHRKGRTPKAQEEPLYLETAGGRGRRQAGLDPDERKFLDKTGMDEKHYRATVEKMANAKPGKGIRLE